MKKKLIIAITALLLFIVGAGTACMPVLPPAEKTVEQPQPEPTKEPEKKTPEQTAKDATEAEKQFQPKTDPTPVPVDPEPTPEPEPVPPPNSDELYLQTVREVAPSLAGASDSTLIDLAFSTCTAMDNGATFDDLGALAVEYGGDQYMDYATAMGVGVGFYCDYHVE